MNREEAIHIVKNNWPEGRHMLSEALAYLIPEFQEDEDEKMRKWIIGYLDNRVMNSAITEEKEACLDAIDWLNKQKHVEMADAIIDKMVFNYGNKPEKGNEEFGKPVNCMKRAYRQGIVDALKMVKQDSANTTMQEKAEIDDAFTNMMVKEHSWEGKELGRYEDVRDILRELLNDERYTKSAIEADLEWLKTVKPQKSAELNETYIADVFEKVGLAKAVREIANDDISKALQAAMIELANVRRSEEWTDDDNWNMQIFLNALDLYKEPIDKQILKSWLKSLKNKVRRSQSRWRPTLEQLGLFKDVIDNPSKANSEACYTALKNVYEGIKEL